MGRVVVAGLFTVDGFMAGAGGDLSVMPMDESFNEHNAARIAEATGLMYGGTTYRQMVGYWPQVPGNPDASPAEQAIAARCAGGIPITVVSDSITEEETGPWCEQTTIVRRSDAHDHVRKLRDQDGTTLVFGSRTLWSDLLAQGLVDDLYLQVGTKIVAGDSPAFAGVPPTQLDLAGIERYGDSVVLHLTTTT